jgi:N-acyl amino acid synthase of PEP-CTERM/exosortase system
MSGTFSNRVDAYTRRETSKGVSTNYFNVVGADDGSLLIETYRVRYQVFCVERGFLDADAYPQLLETDEFDARSIHVLARHKQGHVAGTARLVLHSPCGFPIHSHCTFDDAYAYLRDPASPLLDHYSEISRLAVSKMFRQRADDTFYGGAPRPATDPKLTQEPLVIPTTGPEIVTGIYKYLYHESKRLGITHWLVAMERSLDLMLRRMGFHFKPVGPEVDYYGPVRPYLATIAELEQALWRHPKMAAYMMEGLPRDLAADIPAAPAPKPRKRPLSK